METKPSRSTASSTTKNTSGGGGKKTVTAERRFNRRRYSALLAEAAPRVINSGEELERATKVAEPLLKKGERRTLEENALCQLLLKLIDDYQQSHTLIPDLAPHELLQALLEESGQRQAQLVPHLWLAEPSLRRSQRQAHHQQRTGEATRRVLPCYSSGFHLKGLTE